MIQSKAAGQLDLEIILRQKMKTFRFTTLESLVIKYLICSTESKSKQNHVDRALFYLQ